MSGSDDIDRLRQRLAELEADNARLRGSDAWLRSVLETVPDFIVRLDREGRILFTNRVHPGTTLEQVVGRDVRDFMPPEGREALMGAIAEAATTGKRVETTSTDVGPGGTTHAYLTRIAPLTAGDGRVELLLVATDVSELKQVQRALRESDARLRSAAESLPFTFWVRDGEGRLVVQNERSRREWGDQLGKRIEDMGLPADLLATAQANLARAMGGEILGIDLERVVDGERRFFRAIIAPVRDGGHISGVLGVDFDMTDQRRLEEGLAQAAKIESIGRLAGGVAHDFNNLLTAIIGFADLAEHHLPASSPARIAIERIREAGERGASLTQQLLGFARKQVIQPRTVAVDELVRRGSKLLPRLLGEDVGLILDLAEHLPPVTMDPHQFDQVLVNLAVNARDAMPNGGRLTITTRLAHTEAEDLRRHPEVAPGTYVRFDISDTGTGMSPEVQRRLFEPFYTTKPVGQGTGLGLATCDGIIRQNHGWIAVHSRSGAGTTFSVHLPAANAPAEPLARSDRHLHPVGGNETVLVVEDEDLIREMVAETLGSLGYHVLTAADGEAALGLAARHAGQIHLLLSDVVMPRLGGPETAERLRQRRPGLRVLFASGYAEDAVTRQGRLAPGTAFIGKPYTIADLAARIREVLA